jgi:hypothetical protein
MFCDFLVRIVRALSGPTYPDYVENMDSCDAGCEWEIPQRLRCFEMTDLLRV